METESQAGTDSDSNVSRDSILDVFSIVKVADSSNLASFPGSSGFSLNFISTKRGLHANEDVLLLYALVPVL
jgi:hypothetical protein